MVSGKTFQYRLEANTFGRWGGIFSAPRHYPLNSTYNFLADLSVDVKFDNWAFKDDGIEPR